MSINMKTHTRERFTFTATPPARFAHLCPPGQAFADWCEEKMAPVRAQPTEVKINQLALLLQEQFLARWDSAQAKHRVLGSAQHGCVATVYLSYARELRELRWRVSPPPVQEPVQPSRSQQPYGLFFGDDQGSV